MQKIFTYTSRLSNLFIFISISLLLLTSSCSIQKRIYRSGYAVDWKKIETHSDLYTDNQLIKLEEDVLIEDVSTATLVPDESHIISDNEPLKKVRQDGTYVSDLPDSTECDIIIFENGTEIKVKIKDIGSEKITYIKCEDESGTVFSVKIDDVSEVKIHKGSVESNSKTDANDYEKPKTELFGIAGLVCAVIPFIIPVGGLLAIIFGGISLNRIRKEPHKYKGRGFAIASLILGILQITVITALAAIVIFFW